MIQEFHNPFKIISQWFENEKSLGSPYPERGVLATATKEAIPHSRIVAIREISDHGILFFTQKGSQKAVELEANPVASMTIWMPMQQRQVVLDGKTMALDNQENSKYWNELARDKQVRFLAYGQFSGQKIPSLKFLEEKEDALIQEYGKNPYPLSPYYIGFRLIPQTISFYTLGTATFSEVVRCTQQNQQWQHELLSP